jgi:diguanylate cyclase (GGDEF)-like protein/PAS domain S-box-containing protein
MPIQKTQDSTSLHSGSYTRLARRVCYLLAALMVFLFLGAGTLLVQIADQINRHESERDHLLAQNVLESRKDELNKTLLDYAFWDEAFANTSKVVNPDWLGQQTLLGWSLTERYALNAVFIVSPDMSIVYRYERRRSTGDTGLAWAPGDLERLTQNARTVSEGQAFQTLLFFNGKPALVSAAPIRPLSFRSDIPVEQTSVMVLVDVIGEHSLKDLSDRFGIKGLRPAHSSSESNILLSPQYDVYLTWETSRPGDALLQILLPLLILTAVIFGLIAWYLLHRSIQAAVQIDQSRRIVQKSEERFKDIAEAASDWIWETDSSLCLHYLSERFALTTGFTAGAWIGKPLNELLTFDYAEIERLANGEWTSHSSIPCQHLDAQGREHSGNLSINQVFDGDVLVGYRGTVCDTTLTVEAQEHILHLSRHDLLTGLPNRGYAYEVLQGRLSSNVDEDEGFAILYLDINDFKKVNDLLGHHAADRVLAKVAVQLGELLGPDNFLARLGGDEFLVITSGLPQSGLPRLCERLLAVIEQPLVSGEYDLHLGLSIGVAQAFIDSDDPQELLRLADIALHDAKCQGRQSWRLYDADMKKRIQERRDLELDLKLALQRDELSAVYQPRFDISGKRIIGAEALVRWHHPTKGWLSPAVFVPIAEESGQIVALSDWMLMRACREACLWAEPIFVSVNLSSIEFKRDDLARRITTALEQSGLAPERLEIEVTESVMMDNAEGARALMYELKALGVKLSMDDFGTGYSSLSYLSHYPFDGIKIDRSFVMNLADSRTNNQAIVNAIVALGRSLSMSVTAEGVETAEQLETLQQLECDQAQGYFLAKPMQGLLLAELLVKQSLQQS